jgi:tRNA 2-selenouridine synthase SelU
MDAAAPRNRRDDPSRNAQENVNAAQRARDEEARREQMVKDVWGHLPPHLRDAMLQSFREKYLPQYEDLVRRYYEALAEKSRSGSTDR